MRASNVPLPLQPCRHCAAIEAAASDRQSVGSRLHRRSSRDRLRVRGPHSPPPPPCSPRPPHAIRLRREANGVRLCSTAPHLLQRLMGRLQRRPAASANWRAPGPLSRPQEASARTRLERVDLDSGPALRLPRREEQLFRRFCRFFRLRIAAGAPVHCGSARCGELLFRRRPPRPGAAPLSLRISNRRSTRARHGYEHRAASSDRRRRPRRACARRLANGRRCNATALRIWHSGELRRRAPAEPRREATGLRLAGRRSPGCAAGRTPRTSGGRERRAGTPAITDAASPGSCSRFSANPKRRACA